MNPFGARAAAGELARRLDSTAGASAAPSPELALAGRLRSAGLALESRVAPRPEFRDGLRLRLMAVATVQAAAPAAALAPARSARARHAAPSWSTGRLAGRGSAVAAGALASVVAVSGVAVAGSQSLPGDPFYGVKRTTEAVQLRIADGDVERGTRHLDFAATRLREVRGLTLGRDAVDAGPRLGPSASAGGFTLSSVDRPFASDDALSAPAADQVRDTLTEMDAQTRQGTQLLTSAYRSSRTAAPLRTLARFTTRQAAGLEQLLPSLPPTARPQARMSLALLSDVTEETEQLLGIGTCRVGCDPSQAAPTLPSADSAPGTTDATEPGTAGTTGCDCAAPAPAPAPQPTAAGSSSPGAQPSSPQPSSAPSPRPSSPAPSPAPSNGLPVPVPTAPLPIPSLPVPLPTSTPSQPAVLEPVAPLLPGLNGNAASSSDRAPAPAPTPVPQLAPLPPRP